MSEGNFSARTGGSVWLTGARLRLLSVGLLCSFAALTGAILLDHVIMSFSLAGSTPSLEKKNVANA